MTYHINRSPRQFQEIGNILFRGLIGYALLNLLSFCLPTKPCIQADDLVIKDLEIFTGQKFDPESSVQQRRYIEKIELEDFYIDKSGHARVNIGGSIARLLKTSKQH